MFELAHVAQLGRLADPVATLETIFASSPVAFQLFDAAGRSVRTNPAFAALFGGAPPPGYSAFDDAIAVREGYAELVQRALGGEVISTGVHWYDARELLGGAAPDPRRAAVSATLFPVADAAGRITHVGVMFKDVTAELAIHGRDAAERRRLALLADLSHLLASDLDEAAVLDRVTRLLVPALADRCTAVLIDERGELEAVAGAPFDGDLAAAALDAIRTCDARRLGLGAAGVLVAPLAARGRALGALILAAGGDRALAPDDCQLATRLAERLGLALDNGRLFAAAERARRDAEAERAKLVDENRINQTLIRLGASFATEQDEQRLLQRITDEATALTGAACGAFFWNTDDADGAPRPFTLAGDHPAACDALPVPRTAPLIAATFRGEGPLRVDDLRRDPDHAALAAAARPAALASLLAVPVVSRTGEVLGALFFGHPEPGRFAAHHEQLVLGIAGQAAVALENARLVQALRASEARARAADRRKDEFLAILGHELRNPLAPIVTALELMKLRDPGARREREVIERQVQHLSRLVDDLLDVSRITRGKLALRRERVEIATVVADAIQRVSPLFDQRRHHLTVMVARQGLTVDADVGRLTQVVTNLLSNAAKYTPPGGHVVIDATRDGEAIALRVRDDGVGIDREILDHIFEPFVQAERTRERSDGGLGIGLSLVRSLVELHGGTVAAESDGQGRGARFTVRLPAVAAARPEPATAEVDAAAPTGRRVLVVDDNTDAAELLADALTACGHQVRIARDGAQALAVAAELRPEVAVLDIGLPVMDGYELATRLREDRARAPRKLIALTGYGQDEDRARAHEAGFDEHFVKPADLRTLLHAIEA